MNPFSKNATTARRAAHIAALFNRRICGGWDLPPKPLGRRHAAASGVIVNGLLSRERVVPVAPGHRAQPFDQAVWPS